MAVPKHKTSRSRRNKRRANHRVSAPHIVECPQCHSPKLPHTVCLNCGTYRGRQIIEIEE